MTKFKGTIAKKVLSNGYQYLKRNENNYKKKNQKMNLSIQLVSSEIARDNNIICLALKDI